ncbi:MAG TPA: MFS transporter [Candidatus Binatia bacterium]|nr:MFS transporter [Candidatus Binatia bacterium]
MTDSDTNAGSLRAALPLIVAGFVISFVLVGGGIDTVSVFLNAIAKATDWSRASLSLAVSVGALSAALSTPIIGAAVDRVGVRSPMLAGVGLLAIGFAIVIVMNHAWQFVAANVFLGAGFAASAIFPITVAVTMRVPDRTALALGIVGAGASAGALVLAPAIHAVIAAVGWRNAYVVMGTAVVLTPLPFLALTLPRGQLRRDPTASADPTTARLIDGLRRPGVAALAAVMILPALAGFSVSVHLVPYLTSLGHGGSTAAGALGGTIGISAIGKVGGGFVADRIKPLPTLRLALVLWAFALGVLHYATTPAILVLFVVLYGLAFGTQIAVIPPIAVGVLGSERFGALFGVLQLAAMLASAIGPIASGLIFDGTGRYSGAVIMWLSAVSLAALVAWSMRAAEAKPLPLVEAAT